jgi:YidC/Oxa1 family membrane protein insertase
MDKTTVFFLRTNGNSGVSPFLTRKPSGNKQFGAELDVNPGTTSYMFSLYGGRRQYLLMEHSGLGELDNPGTGARLIIPVVQFLNLLYRYTGNYGWAILLFTVITRIVLFPLMRRQYHSMAKMQKLQPKMKRIQERFKDDRQIMQQKLMEMYKKEGVNPMGGCLPLFIQLPILILLWKAILYCSAFIRLSPGFLWIPDLSMRDPYFILVILTTLAMILQQKMMTPMTAGDAKGSQKYMGYIMPIFMAVFLYNFPAGLWFYYFLTTIFQVGQQYFVDWEMAKAEAASGGTGVTADTGYSEEEAEIDEIQEDASDNSTGRERK